MISILMSIYNGGKWLAQSLESIYAQTETDWEIVAVDDGSTDGTADLLEKAQQKRPGKIRILTQSKNRGLTLSLISAAQAAQGEFLARLDVGDFFEPQKLEKQLNFLKKNPHYGVVGCAYANESKIVHPPIHDAEIRATIFRKNPFAHSAILMRKEFYEKAGGYNPAVKYGQDYDLWFRMLKVGKAANLSEVLCKRSIDPGSISYQKQKEQMRQCLKTQWRYMNKLNPLHYIYLLEPLTMLLIPERIKIFFRNYHA